MPCCRPTSARTRWPSSASSPSTPTTCLTDAGATVFNGIAHLDNDLLIWDQCVTTNKAVIAQRVAGLRPRFYDPSTERPANPDPAQVYGDN